MGYNSEQDDFYKELLRDFKIESAEHYQTILEGVYNLPLESDLSGSPLLEQVYRSTHSLKGAARAINLKDIEKVCSTLEGVFGQLKKNSLTMNSTLKEGVQSYLRIIKELLDNTESNKTTSQSVIDRNIRNIQHLASSAKPASKRNIKEPKKNSAQKNEKISEPEKQVETGTLESGSIRIANEHLIKIVRQSDNFITIRNSISHIREELQDIYSHNRDHKIFRLLQDISEFESEAGKMTDELNTSIRSTLLSTFDSIIRLLPIMTQEIAGEYGKEIEFTAQGGHIEIDRRILTEIKDTLIHILRNCIDHGIEKPEERVLKGKKQKGIISFKVEKLMDGNVRIIISDDGKGIDRENVVSSALKNNIITKKEASTLTASQKDNLIFKSGVSSKKFVTDISGRGLGMSIASEKIEELGGSVKTNSEVGRGTTFTIVLPQSITTFRGLLVQAGKYEVMIPYKHIEKVTRVDKKEIITIGNKPHIKDSSGINIGITRLAGVISVADRTTSPTHNQRYETLILSGEKGIFAYTVDKIHRGYEGILRKAPKPLNSIKNIAGFTLIKNGVTVPVLDINQVTANTTVSDERWSSEEKQREISGQKVLIAEDSITIRAMLRNFVENEGFDVTTASDGKDALDLIGKITFDIIVSDIEMPHMNGFELTREIKSDPSTRDIPVILVTALESEEDKKKGMDAGADAYIVKSSFEKSNLVDTIRRLI
jgi:two-component system chemotaxis sensor kinase CheA